MTLPAHLVESIRSMLAADVDKIAEKIRKNSHILMPSADQTIFRFYVCGSRSLYLRDGRLWHGTGFSRATGVGAPIAYSNGLISDATWTSMDRGLLSLCGDLRQDLENMRPTEIPPILDRWRRIPEWIDLLATGSAPTLYPEWTADDWEALDLIGAEIAAWRLE